MIKKQNQLFPKISKEFNFNFLQIITFFPVILLFKLIIQNNI